MPTHALLFDLDGTLVESDPVHEEAWRLVLAQYGVQLDADGYGRWIRGRANGAIVADLLPHLPAARRLEVAALKEERFRQEARGIAPTPGLLGLIESARSRGIACAVVTNAPRANARCLLQYLGLEPRFSVVVAEEDVSRAKPDPEPYLKALRLLGVPATRALAFEDSPAGVQAAAAAGLPVVAIVTGHSSDALIKSGALIAAADFSSPGVSQALSKLLQTD